MEVGEEEDGKNKLQVRRLRGHKAAATWCVPTRERPSLIATAGEDGLVCFFDLRCKDVQLVMDLGTDNPISSLCFNQGNESTLYVSSGTQVRCFDLHMASSWSWKPLQSYKYNKDEINQIFCNSKSSFLAAADDTGDIKILDIRQNCLYKTLRAGHSSICSAVQFLPWKPWEAFLNYGCYLAVISGGLDSKLVMWDFSKGRVFHVLDFGNNVSGESLVQCCNPAFVHALAVPDMDMLDRVGKICAVARGDAVISLIDVESEIASPKSKVKPRKGSQMRPQASFTAAEQRTGMRLDLDYALGGHTAAASSVTFSLFGERGKYIISGGNDKRVKVWDWTRYLTDTQASGVAPFSINLQKKVNWLCTTPSDSENLVVCDTSKVVKVYTIS